MRPRIRDALTVGIAAIVILAVGWVASGDARAPSAVDSTPRSLVGPPIASEAQSPADLAAAVEPFVICIDPGHSLLEPNISVEIPLGDGSGRAALLTESALNLDVARYVVSLLRERYGSPVDGAPPVEVVMTWGEDDGLERFWDPLEGPEDDAESVVRSRATFCRSQGADILVSLHANAKIPTDELTEFDGLLVGYRDDNDLALAEVVHELLLERLSVDPAGEELEHYMNFGLDQAGWWISEAALAPNIPAILIEPAFMTDRWEGPRLVTPIAQDPRGRRAQIAEAEADAIAAYVDALPAFQVPSMAGATREILDGGSR